MQREVINLHYDEPLVVKLDFGPEGIDREGKYGPQVQYTLNDDQSVMFVPPGARAAILQSGAQAGDTIELRKAKRGTQTVYTASIVGDAAEGTYDHTYEPEPEPAPRQRIAPRHSTSTARKNGPNVGQRAYYQPISEDRQAPGPQRVTARQPQPTALTRRENPFAESMRYAVEIALEARAYAADLGLDLVFSAEDVRAILLSHFIGAQRGGSR